MFVNTPLTFCLGCVFLRAFVFGGRALGDDLRWVLEGTMKCCYSVVRVHIILWQTS